MKFLTSVIKYIFTWVIISVQWLTRWAWKEEELFFKTFLKVKTLNRRPDGTLDSEIIIDRSDALVVCHALASIFNADTNFTEIEFKVRPEYTQGWVETETLIIHIFREKGLSPRILLDAARTERDALRQQLNKLLEQKNV